MRRVTRPACWPENVPAPDLRASAGAWFLYAFLAVALLAPLASDALPDSPGGDAANHVSGIIEARNALREGQFPPRVAPRQHNRERYPFFQFYGHLGYLLGGALHAATGWSPYTAWKLVVGAALACAGYFTFRCAYLLTARLGPALVSGALLVTAPYMQIDVQARFAFPEVLAFCVAPAVLFFAMRCFAAPGALAVIGAAVSWSALVLAHTVVAFYAIPFFGLFFLSYLVRPPRPWRGALRTLLGAGLGGCLAAWYGAAHLTLHSQLNMADFYGPAEASRIYASAWLTRLPTLLAPTFTYPAPVPCPALHKTRLGAQVGWPILAGAALALAYSFGPARRGAPRATVARLAALGGLAFFLTWSPVDFWPALPNLCSCALYSCRFLVFVVLWGSLLGGVGLALAWRGRMRLEHLLGCLLLLGLAAGPYLPAQPATDAVTVQGELESPEMGRGGGCQCFRLSPQALARHGYPPPPGVNLAEWDYGIVSADWRLRHPGTGTVPAPRPGDTLTVAGEVPAALKGETTLTVTLDGAPVLTRRLPPGPFQLSVPITQTFAAERVELGLHTDRAIDAAERAEAPVARGAVACYVFRLAFDSPGPPSRGFFSAEALAPSTRYGHPSTCRLTTPAAALVQLPVLYYPNMLRVTHNGRAVPYRNLGRFVALEVPAGEHVFAVSFAGVRWANVLSAITAAALGAAAVLLLARRLAAFARRHRRLPAAEPAPPSLRAA